MNASAQESKLVPPVPKYFWSQEAWDLCTSGNV